jgi:hypothetical protein
MGGVTVKFVLRCLGLAAVCLALGGVFSSSAFATHNRATQLSWSKGANPNEVEFTIDFVARRGYYGFPELEVGDVFQDPTLFFGDGEGITLQLTVVAVGADIVYAQGQVSHTYPTAGPYTATMGSCCRLSASSGHVNNGDLNYSVHTLVDTAHAISSPHIAVAPVVFCPTSGLCSFAFAGSGAEPGNHLEWRLATPAETGDALFVQPGSPYAPSAASVDPTLGRMSWDTTGATMSPTGLPTYYSTQVVAEEVNSQGETVSDASADFFIALDDDQTQQPDCEDTDGNGSVDNDNDGLCDNWETTGIDSDDDGKVDLTLPGGNPNKPDVFVEIDYMKDRKPQNQALSNVQSEFAKHGIALHAEVGDEVPFYEHVAFNTSCSPCGLGEVDFDVLKSDYFGSSADRSSSNNVARLDARKFAYHYALYANQLLGLNGVSGFAELPGNDLTVTLGDISWRVGGFGAPTIRNEAGTFMHELGHNLGLKHGGGDGVNCKPNYISVMNYTQQTTGIIPAPRLDYSESALPPLDESNLDESLGVQGPSGVSIAYGPGSVRTSSAAGAIDWNRISGIQNGVSADVNLINGEGGCDSPSPSEVLTGHDDWSNLNLAFQATADFADGVHPSVFLQEPDVAAQEVASVDSDGDGLPNIQDECPTSAGTAASDGCTPADTPTVPSSGPSTSSRTAPPGAPDTRLRKARIKGKHGTAEFSFDGSGGTPALAFQCKLDSKPFKPCSSPKTYRHLKAGRHTFKVRATDAVGLLDSAPAAKAFRIG